MTQFTVYKNEDKNSRLAYPYFVDVQSSLTEALNSRLVMPLTRLKSVEIDGEDNNPGNELCPVVSIRDTQYLVLSHQLTSVSKSVLNRRVVDLDDHRASIIKAINLLTSGI